MLATKNPYIESAYEQLQVISQDKQKLWEYEAREKEVRDHNQMIFEAEQRGKFSVVKNMLRMDFSVDIISQITDLSVEEIKKIQKEMEEC